MIAALVSLASNANPVYLSDVFNTKSLTPSKLYQLHTDNAIPAQLPLLTDYIARNATTVEKLAKQGGRFLHVTRVYNDTGERAWTIHVDGKKLKDVRYHIISSQDYQYFKAGYYSTTGFLLKGGHTFHIDSATDALLLIEYRDNYFPQRARHIQLMPQSAYALSASYHLILLSFMLGMLCILIIYSLVQAIQNKNQTVFFYSLYLIFFSIGFAIHFKILPTMTNFDTYRLHSAPFMLSIFFNSLFIVKFLELGKNNPTLKKLILLNGAICLLNVPFSLIEYVVSAQIVRYSAVLWAILATYAGVKRLIDGYRPAANFCLAFVWLVFPLLIILVGRDLIGSDWQAQFDSDILIFIGATLEALFLALAIIHYQKISYDSDQRFRRQLEKNVRERTQKLSESQEAQASLIMDLKEANSAKTHFLANMSHEIRTPLTAIIGYSDSLQSKLVKPEEQSKAIGIIAKTSHHLLDVINDILDISKIESGKIEVDIRATNLNNIVQQAIETSEPKAIAKNIVFNLDYVFPIPAILVTDGTKLKQMLINLLNNAIKFTHVGSVTLTISVEQENILFTVSDTGIGLNQQQLEIIFTPFLQADQSINRRYGGSGLGLSICQQFAQQLGGSLNVASEVNKGSTFVISLPLNTASQQHQDQQWLNDITETAKLDKHPKTKNKPLEKFDLTILLADDHNTNRELIALVLKRSGVNVIEVDNGASAVEKAREQAFDMILMDIQMPVMDGVQAFKAIQTFDTSTPVVALTANNMQHEIDQYYALGFYDYLAKPLQLNTLSRLLTKVKNENLIK